MKETSRWHWAFGAAVVAGWIAAGAARADSPPVVSGIGVSQRTDGSKLVDIYYNLADADGDACTVTLLASDDGGSTWTAPITALSGDVGAGITPGTGRHIVWNSAADLHGAYGTNYKVRVCADDAQGPGSDMVLIPTGSFQMGDTFNEGRSNERPVHTVSLDGFYMDRYEVTKGFWDTVKTWAISNGYDLINAPGKAGNHPVYSVNWYDCVKWCNARSEHQGRTPCYYTDAGLTAVYKAGEIAPYVNWGADGFRLPTEAEWEKAARGGTRGHRFPWSDTDTIQHARANYYSYWSSGEPFYSYDTSPTSAYHPLWGSGAYPYTSPAGFFNGMLQYKADWGWPGTATSYQTSNGANGYGLHDMAGNVWEWCNDWYLSSYYSTSPGSNPPGPASGTSRILRGGDWLSVPRGCRVAIRYGYSPRFRYSYLGFRCASGTHDDIVGVCGNGLIETGEDCEGGDCCNPVTCRFETVTVQCRPGIDACDAAEFCDGFSVDCPPDDVVTACIHGDDCCPVGCDNATDLDCP